MGQANFVDFPFGKLHLFGQFHVRMQRVLTILILFYPVPSLFLPYGPSFFLNYTLLAHLSLSAGLSRQPQLLGVCY